MTSAGLVDFAELLLPVLTSCGLTSRISFSTIANGLPIASWNGFQDTDNMPYAWIRLLAGDYRQSDDRWR